MVFPFDVNLSLMPACDFKVPAGKTKPEDMFDVGCLDNLSTPSTTETKEIFCLGKKTPIKEIVTRVTKGLNFSAKCWSKEVLALAFGGEWVIAEDGSCARLVVSGKVELPQMAACLQWAGDCLEDGTDVNYGLIFPCVQLISTPSLDFGAADDTDALLLNFEFKAVTPPEDPNNLEQQVCIPWTDDPVLMAAV